ncbi:copper homeostasis protein CutC [Pedobacter sandarakinus]|uniref:copper homeostasis protein CutC n=1 Tax=Pedobacter sandarakinus TaxID=353156 RepID=UPI0022475A8E|nr:copper homeostasis protein CutC [Pedobacter sandarakinus]MCX2574463.1 copper homeostasis protein CutC [Pedobacter sandarakinus]
MNLSGSVTSSTLTNNIDLEICANGYESAWIAQQGGATRVELCNNLAEGGTTPSYAQISLTKKHLNIEVWPIIRPRGGDFLYNDLELNLMKEDIKICKSLNCDGIVIGLLRQDGTIDIEGCKILIDLASPLPVAFHRAFDMTNDMEQALEDLISLGIVRVLSSGGETSALAGVDKLARLIEKAKGRIAVMPGAGINANNIKIIMKNTGAMNFHASAKDFVPSKMRYRNTSTKMGTVTDEYQHELTSLEQVKAIVEAITS